MESFESTSQAEIDSARNAPEIQGALAAMTGTDTDGTPVAIATIRLNDTGDERIQNAERRISELAAGDEGPLRVSSLSPVVVEDEYKEATELGMAPLIGLALLLIVALLLLFTRAISDTLLTLTGLILSITWVVGAEGWLGPNGLGLMALRVRLPRWRLSSLSALQWTMQSRQSRTTESSELRASRLYKRCGWDCATSLFH